MLWKKLKTGSKILIINIIAMIPLAIIEALAFTIASFGFDISPLAATLISITLLLFGIPIYVLVAGHIAQQWGMDENG